MPTPNNPPARIFFLKARASNKAIVFRRGPTDWIQMLVWHLDNDTLEFGQWINKKVPMRNCDISPSGKYLIYFVDNFEHGNSRTLISKPPFWTALTAWEHGDAHFGAAGGLFADDNTVLLNLPSTQAHKQYPIPPHLNIHSFQTQKEYSLWKGQINLLHEHRLEMNGWTAQHDEDFIKTETAALTIKNTPAYWLEIDPQSAAPIEPKLWKKPITNSTALYLITFYHPEHRKNIDLFYLGRKETKIKLEGITWADIDDKNRIIATKDGQLYASKIATDNSVDYTNLVLLHDLNTQKPKSMSTPPNMKTWEE